MTSALVTEIISGGFGLRCVPNRKSHFGVQLGTTHAENNQDNSAAYCTRSGRRATGILKRNVDYPDDLLGSLIR
jgi:hypothetical protein